MAITQRTSLAIMIAGGVAAATLPVAVAATATAAPSTASTTTATASHVVAATKATGPRLRIKPTSLRKGDTVRLRGTRYPKVATSLYITICANPPGATNCDVDLSHVKQISYKGTGRFKTKYKIATTKFDTASGRINCKRVQCVVGTTNALAPKDHSYNGVAKFTVRKKR